MRLDSPLLSALRARENKTLVACLFASSGQEGIQARTVVFCLDQLFLEWPTTTGYIVRKGGRVHDSKCTIKWFLSSALLTQAPVITVEDVNSKTAGVNLLGPFDLNI